MRCLLIFEHFVYNNTQKNVKFLSQFSARIFCTLYWEFMSWKNIFQKQLNLLQWCMILIIGCWYIFFLLLATYSSPKCMFHFSFFSLSLFIFYHHREVIFLLHVQTIVQRKNIISIQSAFENQMGYWMASKRAESSTHKYICRY